MTDQMDNVIRAFSEEHVERLTGISRNQLRYWDRTEFFVPSFADENRRRSFSRVYSFRDIVCLQVLNSLRNDAKVPLPHLREVKQKLAHLGEDMWVKTTLYVVKKRVVFVNPETDEKEDVLSGQLVLQIPLKVVRGDMEKRVSDLWTRGKQQIGKVEKRRGVASNQPVVAGTRISVRAIQAFHEAGYSDERIQQQYPSLTISDIRAALAYKKVA
mmetsp:Transcript_55489/g.76908  ORF Transcript_55489/g.76908 Transcript_55489/m.76908 type:complete len:214 (+) Transcript_55489:51-692(+)